MKDFLEKLIFLTHNQIIHNEMPQKELRNQKLKPKKYAFSCCDEIILITQTVIISHMYVFHHFIKIKVAHCKRGIRLRIKI